MTRTILQGAPINQSHYFIYRCVYKSTIFHSQWCKCSFTQSTELFMHHKIWGKLALKAKHGYSHMQICLRQHNLNSKNWTCSKASNENTKCIWHKCTLSIKSHFQQNSTTKIKITKTLHYRATNTSILLISNPNFYSCTSMLALRYLDVDALVIHNC